jgi:hypothetical protein
MCYAHYIYFRALECEIKMGYLSICIQNSLVGKIKVTYDFFYWDVGNLLPIRMTCVLTAPRELVTAVNDTNALH